MTKQHKISCYWIMKKLFLVLSILGSISTISCGKFLEGVDLPESEISGDAVYTNDITATAVVMGIYSRMSDEEVFTGGYNYSVSVLAGLSADELKNYSIEILFRECYENALRSNNLTVRTAIWEAAYQYIYTANAVLEGLAKPNGVSSATKAQLQGEARLIRAFCLFYLVNLFGDVPLPLTTDYRINEKLPRASSAKVYEQVINDLKAAQELLQSDYVTTERVRPNKWVATALLARVYLYTQAWADAEEQATAIINNTTTYQLGDSLSTVFLINSRETIWQLRSMALQGGINTWEAYFFILSSAPGIWFENCTALSSQLLQAFEAGDQRKAHWVGNVEDEGEIYYFPYKYKVRFSTTPVEYSVVLRLAEQYLIRAEARAQQNKIAGARADIDIVRRRAGLPATTAYTQAGLLRAIEHERQVELFTEWGHRWLDLKRTGRADEVLGAVKTWEHTDSLYPIPQEEILKNPNMTQNAGYE